MTSRQQKLGIGIVLAIGAVLAALILGIDRRSAGESAKGRENSASPNAARGDPEAARPAGLASGSAGHEEHSPAAEKGAHDKAERIAMPDAVLKTAGIALETAGPAQIRTAIDLPGAIAFNQDRLVHVVPRLAGIVASSPRDLGERVAKGEILAIIESQALADLKSERLAAEKRLELARATYEREKRLWEEKISAEQDYLAARQALAEAEIAHQKATQKLLALGLTQATLRGDTRQLTHYELRAPVSGVVVEKHLARGEAVREDSSALVLADLSTLWAEITVYAQDLDAVRFGQRVEVRSTAPPATAAGTVSYVGPLVGEQTRAAKARVLLDNRDGRWRPGMFVTVGVVRDETTVPVAVPAAALQELEGRTVVFVREGEAFEARPVETGRRDGRRVAIVRGLAAGERYAAANSFIVKAELGKGEAGHEH